MQEVDKLLKYELTTKVSEQEDLTINLRFTDGSANMCILMSILKGDEVIAKDVKLLYSTAAEIVKALNLAFQCKGYSLRKNDEDKS